MRSPAFSLGDSDERVLRRPAGSERPGFLIHSFMLLKQKPYPALKGKDAGMSSERQSGSSRKRESAQFDRVCSWDAGFILGT